MCIRDSPKAIHYTDGGPWFEDYQDTFYGDLWKEAEHNLIMQRDWENES